MFDGDYTVAPSYFILRSIIFNGFLSLPRLVFNVNPLFFYLLVLYTHNLGRNTPQMEQISHETGSVGRQMSSACVNLTLHGK